MITLFFCLAIGMVLASVLKLASARNVMTVRSLDWNQAIPVLEAGVEEAMTHIYDDTSASANGWTARTVGTNGNIVYSKQRTFSDGSYFYATIYNASSNTPYIISQGYVRAPMKASQYISRMVMVTCSNPPNFFKNALTTSGAITISGGGHVDSFDSRIGGYNALTNRSANGNIATDSTNNPAIAVGTGEVYGTVNTGPGGVVTVGGGSVGDVAWNTNAGNSGIQSTSWVSHNMNVNIPSNQPPTYTFTPTPGATSLGGSNATFIGTGNYQTTGDFTSSDSTKPLIVTGNAVLYITGKLTVSGSGFIQIRPGASLTVIVGGDSTVSGGGVVNGTGFASNFSLLGLNGCSKITYSGSAAFIGTVYAPQADLTISGSAGAFGAIVSKTANLSGGASLSHDDSLGVNKFLIATGWKEL